MKFSLLPLLSAFTLTSAIPTLTTSSLAPRTPAENVTFVGVTASGNGCPAGSYSVTISEITNTLTIGFDAFTAAYDGGSDASEREKNCDMFITLDYPTGCTTATIDATSHGFALLESGVIGVRTDQYNLSPGFVEPSPGPTVFSGPEWEFGVVYTQEQDVSSLVFAATENQSTVLLVVRTRVFVQSSGGNAFGQLSVDDLTIEVLEEMVC